MMSKRMNCYSKKRITAIVIVSLLIIWSIIGVIWYETHYSHSARSKAITICEEYLTYARGIVDNPEHGSFQYNRVYEYEFVDAYAQAIRNSPNNTSFTFQD